MSPSFTSLTLGMLAVRVDDDVINAVGDVLAMALELRVVLLELDEEPPKKRYESESRASTPSAMAAIILLRSAGDLSSSKAIKIQQLCCRSKVQ